MTRSFLPRLIACCLLLVLASGCATPWRTLHEGDGWTLLVQDAAEVEIHRYEEAFHAGRAAVEDRFGAFEGHVRVFAWTGGVRMDDGTRGTIEHGEDLVQDVPGIGPARVRAFHARGSDFFGDRSGVFLGQADAGTAVHELVHARLAEFPTRLPLWFEEGLAMVLGDGDLIDGVWQVDGLACWPLRELAEESLNDAQLRLLLSLKAGDAHDLRTNVLVHFLGWAVVFDLYRESGSLDWERWRQTYANGISVDEVRRRMNRTLDPDCPKEWLERLSDPNRGVRLACTKGIWKLRSRAVASQLIAALRTEEDPDVAASLTVNLLATAGEVEIGRRNWWRMWRIVSRVLRDPKVEDETERKALRTLYEYYRYQQNTDRSKQALKDLSRFLEE